MACFPARISIHNIIALSKALSIRYPHCHLDHLDIVSGVVDLLVQLLNVPGVKASYRVCFESD